MSLAEVFHCHNDRNVKPIRHPNEPDDPVEQLLTLRRREFRQKMILDIDHNENGIFGADKRLVHLHPGLSWKIITGGDVEMRSFKSYADAMEQEYSLRDVREKIVREHIDAENRRDAKGTVNTFHSARYEVFPFGAVADGAAAVEDLLSGLFNSFPDFHVELLKTYHSDDAVIIEVEMSGTQAEQWGDIPATGRKMKVPLLAICVFEADRMICEKIYFDMATVLKQLTG